MPRPAQNSELTPVFAHLREILAAYQSKLNVIHDRPDNYYLDTYTIGPNKKPIFFGGVRVGKNYVSYYLMCIYDGTSPLVAEISPALKKHMQGKACFNFKKVDRALFTELSQLTKRGYSAWKKLEWVD